MSFLEKFKGKTTLLKKNQVGQLLGQKSSASIIKQNPNQLHLLKLAQIPQVINPHSPDSTNLLKRKKTTINSSNLKTSNIKMNNKNQQSQSQPKKIIENPFLVQNEFFLDEEQHQAVLKKRKQDEIKQRIQKQRKKREQIKQQMMKSMRNSPQKSQRFTKKQWVKLGGLGANIGGEQWTKKKTLQQKMLKFAEDIKRINLKKSETPSSFYSQSMDMRPIKQISDKSKQSQVDPRTLGIKYSKSIQKPTFYTLQKTRYQSKQMRTYNSDFQPQIPHIPIRQSMQLQDAVIDPQENQFSNLKMERNYSQLQRLQDRHKQFKNLIYGNKK